MALPSFLPLDTWPSLVTGKCLALSKNINLKNRSFCHVILWYKLQNATPYCTTRGVMVCHCVMLLMHHNYFKVHTAPENCSKLMTWHNSLCHLTVNVTSRFTSSFCFYVVGGYWLLIHKLWLICGLIKSSLFSSVYFWDRERFFHVELSGLINVFF